MNWGNKILIGYLLFVALIITLVVVSVNQNIDLVAADYYAKELNFQSDIRKMENTQLLKEDVKVSIQKGIVNIEYPKEMLNSNLSGSILIYKPSNAKWDKTFKVVANNGMQQIDLNGFEAGMVKVKMDWKSDTISYLSEHVLVIE